jgi:putative peptide zinc metalloprotease protein
VEYVEPSDVRTIAAGFVVEVLVHDGQGVQAGDEILRLSNPDLELECKAALSMLQSSEEKCTALRSQRKHSELQAEEALRESLLVKANSLVSKVNALHLKAPRDGILIARTSRNLPGSFLAEGQSIGMVVDPSKIEISASIPQYAWESVAHNVDAPVSIYMQSGDHWTGKIRKTLPRTSDILDSPSLGGLYGGPITVVQSKAPNGESQLKTVTPRLHTRIELNEPARKTKLISMSSNQAPPPPGAPCSVKMAMQNEAVWQTGLRWIKAGMQAQFRETKQQSIK